VRPSSSPSRHPLLPFTLLRYASAVYGARCVQPLNVRLGGAVSDWICCVAHSLDAGGRSARRLDSLVPHLKADPDKPATPAVPEARKRATTTAVAVGLLPPQDVLVTTSRPPPVVCCRP
jgi:hypothetical protein